MITDTHRQLTPDAADTADCSHCTPDGWCHYHRGYYQGVADGWTALAQVVAAETARIGPGTSAYEPDEYDEDWIDSEYDL
ncbi:hypothetical protein [Actinoalloteichus sp. GBA129-24]|uniref:hypothetical protein n=1 Tax=Actinoalloteichus sp. GBA129-24 TaxID=1612551 RepID=UPI0009503B8B|nr:hypothetical protein [Actinoalloteichus sp. GBA129-24]APU18609.1 hypothetical protein UA75_02850 [Actinoalloteichus sp. GBA129-24]